MAWSIVRLQRTKSTSCCSNPRQRSTPATCEASERSTVPSGFRGEGLSRRSSSLRNDVDAAFEVGTIFDYDSSRTDVSDKLASLADGYFFYRFDIAVNAAHYFYFAGFRSGVGFAVRTDGQSRV